MLVQTVGQDLEELKTGLRPESHLTNAESWSRRAELTHVAQDSSGRPNLDMNLKTSMGSPPSQPAPKPS